MTKAQIKLAFDSYAVAHRSRNFGYEADIALFEANTVNLIGRLYFIKDGDPLPPNSSNVNGPQIYFPLSRYNEIVSTLRLEKPLTVALDTVSLAGAVYSGKELVGEEEG